MYSESVEVVQEKGPSNVGLARLVFPTRKVRRCHLGRRALTPGRAGKYLPYRIPSPDWVSPYQEAGHAEGSFFLATSRRL